VLEKRTEHPYARKGFVAQHRLVMEKKLKRYLKPTEQVHHISMVKTDNDIKNLDLFSGNTDHFKCHGTLNKCVDQLLKMKVLRYSRKTKTYSVKKGL